MWVATVKVNARDVSPRTIFFLLQRDPYPGNLRYSMEISEEDDRMLPKELRNLRNVESFGEARQIASEVEWLLAHYARQSSGVEFFANSIEQIASDDYAIRFSGRCSRAAGEK